MTQHPPIMHVISLGAGVQSTTMALMAAHGEIEPMPDAAIFADTGAEPKAVYTPLRLIALGLGAVREIAHGISPRARRREN